MKILLLPYHFRNYIASGIRVSGIDECMLRQQKVLSKKNQVKTFLSFSDIEHQDVVVYSRESTNTKERQKTEKQKILGLLRKTIESFKPDVILSNHGFNETLYRFLDSFDIPVLYLSHSLPGTPADLFGAYKLESFLQRGHSLGCVSEFHKNKTEKYYSGKRSAWNPNPVVKVDCVVPSSFAVKTEVYPCKPKLVRHISACNETKGTFIIHSVADQTDITAEIFTTTKHVGGHKEEEYLKTNLEKYSGKENLLINFDIPHSEIMSKIKDSCGFFVGKAQSDTFTITSIEALQAGIPLLIFGDKEVHPANNFVGTEFRKYVSYFRTKAQFRDIINRYSSMTLEERSELAYSCLNTMGIESFEIEYQSALERAIEKFKSTRPKNIMENFFE